MADPRFFTRLGPFTVQQLAEIAGCDVRGDATLRIEDVAPLDLATQGSISFLDNIKYKQAMLGTKASACILHPDMAEYAPDGIVCLVSKAPYASYAKIAAAFYPARSSDAVIHDTAVIDPMAEIGQGVSIGAHSVIGAGVVVGDHTFIASNVTLSHCLIGQSCHIHTGVRIGQDGFGFAPTPTGMIPVPQLGRVIMGDHVNIGANTCIDRGAGPDTVIGAGSIIDNLVQIGHNVQLGQGCIITAQVGISGSTKIGNYCVFGGQSGTAGHLTIGDGVRVAGQSGVTQDIEAGIEVAGFPAQERRSYWKERAFLRRLVKKKQG